MSDSSSSEGTSQPPAKRSALHIDLDNSLIAWNPARPGGNGSTTANAANRRKIRAQASRSSATQRKATMATKAQRESELLPQQRVTPPSSSAQSTPGAGREEVLLRAQRLRALLSQSHSGAPQGVDFQQFVGVVDALRSQQNWLTRALRETTLAQTNIRSDMRDAFTVSPALFQATLFLAGTFSNTCGLSYADVKMGVGMAFMRGASLDAVRYSITSSEGEHWVSMAVALLAGWELRFGDRESYEIHMKAYRGVFGSPLDLEENSIAMMRDFAFESLREQLNNLTIEAPLRSSKPSEVWNIGPGFDVFSPVYAPEVKSLLAIVRDTTHYDPRAPGALEFIRNQGLKTMSWTPHHGESIEPLSTFEGRWDVAELTALLHVRAATLIILCRHSYLCHNMYKAKSYLDIMGAADVHAMSCIHLNTDSLIGTKYQYAAVWARVTLGAISRDPSRDALFIPWLKATGLTTWDSLRSVMESHLLQDVFYPQTRDFFDTLSRSL
jgi:hypothetical protein